jgi:hypothetical protein
VSNRVPTFLFGRIVASTGDCGRSHQLTQTQLLRRAGFSRTLLLLEGSQWKARETILHVDGANITSEKELHCYMVREAFANVLFLESPDQSYTAIALAAISQILAKRRSPARRSHRAPPPLAAIDAHPANDADADILQSFSWIARVGA